MTTIELKNKNLASDIQKKNLIDGHRAKDIADKGIKVIKLENADASSLMAISYYGNTIIFHKYTNWGDEEARILRLLKEAANNMGYRLVKK